MKNIIRFAPIVLLLVVATIAYGAVPPVNVIVSDASGKVAFKGSTASNGSFATSNLKSGNYVVQFNSKSAEKGAQYALVISAGKKKVSANAVSGEKLAAGGVAMKVDVGPGLNITGQVASEASAGTKIGKNGKKMVWIGPQLGSNMGGHWVEEGSAEAVAAKNAGSMSTQELQNKQGKGIGLGGQ